MIVKLTGKVDGKEVAFERMEGDRWETTVPYDLDGMYVVEITAVNDRGLIAYRTKMLLIIDLSTLCIKLLPYDYFVELSGCGYGREFTIRDRRGGYSMDRIQFIFGEDKHLKFIVRSPNGEPFTISEARYRLKDYDEIESEGECEIDGRYLDIKLQPKRKSHMYDLEITYKVSDSVRKAKWKMDVV